MKWFLKWILPPQADREDPKIRARVGKRSGMVGIGANAVLFLGKLLVGLASGSVAIVADAMNNLADGGSAVVTLLGFRLAEIPPDEKHPFGHARFEYLSGLAVAAMIVVIGVELMQSAAEKIFYPEKIVFSGALVAVLVGSIAVKLLLAAMNTKLGRAIDSQTLLATAADSRNDCISTGAVLLSALFARMTDIQIDGFAGLAVAVFILWSGIDLAKDTISPQLQRSIVQELKKEPKILGFHDLMVHDYGPGQRFASVHAEMDRKEDPMACHEIIDNVERRVLENHRIHLVIHYDPVVTDDEELNEMRREVKLVLHSIDPRLSFHDFRMVRGEKHTNLIFDMAVPADLADQQEQIHRQLDTAINLRATTTYYTVVTFESSAFNTDRIWNEE